MISESNDKRLKDFDLRLFQDSCKELSDYRIHLMKTSSNKKYNQILRKHNKLIKKLANRLNIKVLI